MWFDACWQRSKSVSCLLQESSPLSCWSMKGVKVQPSLPKAVGGRYMLQFIFPRQKGELLRVRAEGLNTNRMRRVALFIAKERVKPLNVGVKRLIREERGFSWKRGITPTPLSHPLLPNISTSAHPQLPQSVWPLSWQHFWYCMGTDVVTFPCLHGFFSNLSTSLFGSWRSSS